MAEIIDTSPFDEVSRHYYNMDDPAEHAFEIKKVQTDDNATFSMEAVTGVAQHIKTMVIARASRHWNDTGKPPTRCRIMVTVVMDNEQEG